MSLPDPCSENYDDLKLVRDGTFQDERLIPALDPTSAPVNGRGIADGLIFAKSYSEYLNYYNSDNVIEGNWLPFFSSDPSVLLATAVVQDIDHYKLVVQASFDFLNTIANESDSSGIKNNLTWLFAYAATFVRQVDGIQNALPPEIALRSSLRNTITSRLAPLFTRLISYYKADAVLAPAQRLVLDDVPTADADNELIILGSVPVSIQSVITGGLTSLWITDNSSDWSTFNSAIIPDASVYGNPAGSEFERANHISTHNLFSGIFDQFLKSLAKLAIDANAALTDSLNTYDKHEPHYALFLSFLQLLEYARSTINTLTSRHLDFYYREVLQLAERPAQPSKAHLILEPAKNVESYEVVSGTQFKAKDLSGNEVFFANDTSLVVNQATLTDLKKMYRYDDEWYSAPIANSDDGTTTELKAVDKSWHPFFNKTFTDGVLTSIDMPPATLGFFVASHYLLLAEGQRTITITMSVQGFGGTVGTNYASGVVCSLSGEKGWFDVDATVFKATDSTTLQLILVIPGDQPAVVALDTKLHGLTIDAAAPVLKITLLHDDSSDYLFKFFENVTVGNVTVNVNVDRVKALTLSNDFGSIDPSKPFQPFGAEPVSGSAMILGSKEVFLKQSLQSCTLNISWKNIPDIKSVAYLKYEEYYPSAPYDWYTKAVPGVQVSALVRGAWSYQSSQILFDGDSEVSVDVKPASGVFNPADLSSFVIDDAYTAKSKSCFIKLSLPWGMGHAAFRDSLADYFLSVANGGSPPKPTAPYTPEIQSIYLSYSAEQSFRCDNSDEDQFESRQARLFHITDFGIAEQHVVLKTDAPDTSIYLFPQFRHLNEFDDALPALQPVLHEAEFYIGVKGLVPPQSLSILFECVDGTANPLSIKPDPHIQWSYLRTNEWIPFEANDVQDGTEELLKSDIVTLAMPRDATSDNTLFPTGLHWIRLAVQKNSDAVCKLTLVSAQAIEVELQDVDATETIDTLPANTISKLEHPTASIKKVTQPAATFDGKSAEDSNSFYVRISERLRHKDRAVTIWDIEHLVLDAFPEIHRVKCLNHTQYDPNDTGTGIYKELAAGHITVITIPNLVGQSQTDPLKPYTSLAVLEEIEDYLNDRLTCFATLHVRNPQFEEVRVDFKLRLYDGFDETYYVNKLKESITQFLSPWAYEGGEPPSFGGKIYQSVLINFIEEQEYVDYITDFHLFQDINGVQSTISKEFVEGTRAVSVLVSVPASKHSITVIDPVEEESIQEECGCEE